MSHCISCSAVFVRFYLPPYFILLELFCVTQVVSAGGHGRRDIMHRSISDTSNITKSTTTVAAAALLAAFAVFVLPSGPTAEAKPIVTHLANAGPPLVQAKKSLCDRTNWPNYEPSCLFDLRRSGAIPAVRIIALR